MHDLAAASGRYARTLYVQDLGCVPLIGYAHCTAPGNTEAWVLVLVRGIEAGSSDAALRLQRDMLCEMHRWAGSRRMPLRVLPPRAWFSQRVCGLPQGRAHCVAGSSGSRGQRVCRHSGSYHAPAVL